MKSGLAGGLESAGLGSWAAESAHFTPEELRKGFRVKRSFMIHGKEKEISQVAA
jgi:hypothetical protein